MAISPKVLVYKNSKTICIPIVQSIVFEHTRMLLNLWNNNAFISFYSTYIFYSGIEYPICTQGAMYVYKGFNGLTLCVAGQLEWGAVQPGQWLLPQQPGDDDLPWELASGCQAYKPIDWPFNNSSFPLVNILATYIRLCFFVSTV